MTGESPLRLRAGRSVFRTLYRVWPDGREELCGVVDTPELAATIVDAVNRAADDEQRGHEPLG